MGQKINPNFFRLGENKTHKSIWYAEGEEYISNLVEDVKIREYLNGRLNDSMVADVIISRRIKSIQIDIHTARPGKVIGKKGSEISKLKEELTILINKKADKKSMKKVFINIHEVKNPWTSAKLLAQSVGEQLKNRVSHRRAIKRAIDNAKKAGIKGVKVQCAGRLGGSDMARTENYKEGSTPLHTLRSDIDYCLEECETQYGIIGIKVWLYKGDIV